MLRLKNLRKSYTTAGFTQHALDGVSVAFRNNEFAAVLGPSGSGKTTMLNIIGGLDRYDSGDLEIDNISTENYKARDWDTYRNNRIGFVFQSYNLIPHQSVLANVELALTLSGVTRGERRRRAIDTLEEVGLVEHIRKKPGQLSGGQMQRVAIARALINDPEILLADEPTGALDTTTSKQVMELLTKIAKNRLVIMVTHNNALAEKYANRTIHLTDGKVTSDSRPFDPETESEREAPEPRRSSMSFITAIMLSFSNLMTKKGRTFTTAFAGSIGIIGIATILAFSNGINTYIRNVEEETLSVYPLTIQEQGFDLSSLFGGGDDSEVQRGGERRERPPDTVREFKILETVFSAQTLNDLAALKEYIDEKKDVLDAHVTTVHYMYSVTPQIYLADTSKGIDQVNPDSIFSGIMGAQELGMQSGMNFGMASAMQLFHELPNNPDLYESQYEVLVGRWPQNYDEAVLIVSSGVGIMDFSLYSMGIRDRDELRAMLESVMQSSDIEVGVSESEGFYPYDTFLNMGYKVVNPADMYQYDEVFEVWVDKSGDTVFMEELIATSIDLKIVGIARPDQDATTMVLNDGINYSPDLVLYLMENSAETDIVKDQLASPDINVISGNTFAYERENPPSSFDFSKIFSVDEEAIQDAMGFDSLMGAFDFDNMEGLDLGGLDLSGLNMSGFDMSAFDFGSMDMSGFSFDQSALAEISPPEFDIGALTGAIAGSVNIAPDAMAAVMAGVMSGFLGSINISDFIIPGLPPTFDGDALTAEFMLYLSSLDPDILTAGFGIDQTVMEAQIAAALQDYMMVAMAGYMTQMTTVIEQQIAVAMTGMAASIQSAMQDAMRQMSRQMQRAMRNISSEIEESISKVFEDMVAEMEAAMDNFDSEALADAFNIDFSEEAVFELMTSIMNPTTTSYDQNLFMLGYGDQAVPSQILIYPRSFEAKQEVLDFLDRYNTEMEDSDQPDKVVYFTDIVGLMMSTVTSIIDMVSYALVSFVSVALVVSSIMIGVITFVSVLERKKEIGILRAVGASKGNIRQVFNAETLIIGFVAGVIGVLVTYLIAFVANIILYDALDIENLVLMPPTVPVLLVMISMFLTYLAGLLPASAAAGKPPVEALRSE